MATLTAAERFYWLQVPKWRYSDQDLRRDILRQTRLDTLVKEIDKYIRTKPKDRNTDRVMQVAAHYQDVIPGNYASYAVSHCLKDKLEGLWRLEWKNWHTDIFAERRESWKWIVEICKSSRHFHLLERYTAWLMT